jgi:hypothetical protein
MSAKAAKGPTWQAPLAESGSAWGGKFRKWSPRLPSPPDGKWLPASSENRPPGPGVFYLDGPLPPHPGEATGLAWNLLQP